MLGLGFELQERQVGSSIGWELACIPQGWMDDTSKRRAEIEEKLPLRKGSLDAADSRYAELVAKETRRKKDTEKPRHELFGVGEEAKEYGVTPEFLRQTSLPPEAQGAPPGNPGRSQRRRLEGRNGDLEQHSHWNEADLTKALAERAMGKLRLRDIRELVAGKRRTRDLVRLGEIQTEKPNLKRNQ